MSETTCLTLLPAEILHHVLQWVDPRDLGRLPRASRFMRDYIRGNRKLWKDIYLNHLDAPRQQDIDWQQELRDLVRLQIICADADPNNLDNETDLLFVHSVVTRLLRHASGTGGIAANRIPTHASSRNASLLTRIFRDENARSAFFTRSFVFKRSRGPGILRFSESNVAMQQASAHLHCLWGRPILNSGRTRRSRLQPFALSKVYDLREYTPRTRWGLFMDDGSDRIDWEKVEAIMLVLGSNIHQVQANSPAFLGMWDSPFAGSWAGSWVPTPGRKLSDLDLRDPYGISGTWLRVVCFIDYNDFFAYNFLASHRIPDDYPCPALDTGEATRLILMKLHVTAIEPPGEEDGQDLPVVHFRGISRSLHSSWDINANSDLRGICRLTRNGDVRWTTFSMYDGEERWRSESVQVGGVRAARGVLGNWFDINYDEHGPAGPTAFWKLNDPRSPGENENDDESLIHDFLQVIDGFNSDPDSDEEFDGDYVVGEWGEDDEDDDIDDDEEREAMEHELQALNAPGIDMTVIFNLGHGLGPGHEHGHEGYQPQGPGNEQDQS